MPGARQPLSHSLPALPRALWTFSLLKELRAGSDGAFSALGEREHCQRGAVLQQWQLLAPWPGFGILAAGSQPGAVGVSVPRAFTPPGYELAAHQHTAPRAANQAVAACPIAASSPALTHSGCPRSPVVRQWAVPLILPQPGPVPATAQHHREPLPVLPAPSPGASLRAGPGHRQLSAPPPAFCGEETDAVPRAVTAAPSGTKPKSQLGMAGSRLPHLV